jgi:TRAP-type C4-dicarboxylate transport system permease small subunit
MTAIYDQLSHRWRKRFMIGIASSTSGIMFLLAWYAARYVWAVYQLGSVYPVLRVPTWAVYAIAPIGLFLAGVQYAMAAYQNCVSPEIYIAFHRQDRYEHPEVQEI